jgi:hypothetical protein
LGIRGLCLLAGERRNGEGRERSDDQDDDEKLEEREAALIVTALSQAICQTREAVLNAPARALRRI